MSRFDERIALPSERESIPRARHFVRRVVRSESTPDVLEVVELLTSELITNAVLHSGTACELRVCIDDGLVRIEVADGSPQRPVVRHDADPHAIDGRGLQFVDRLATRWGVDDDPLGKRVWFELAG